jgi:hypothetical protein
VVGALALVLGLLTSCGGSQYQYVNNSSEGAYFKVPSAWALFHLTQQDKEGRAAALPTDTQRIWHVAFDAAKPPKQDDLAVAEPTSVVGDVQIYALSASDNDQASQSALRRIIFGGIDPVLQDPGTPAQWEVVSYTPVTSGSGIVGSRTVINVPSSTTPGKWTTIDGSEMFDATLGRAYLLQMRCDSQCYLSARQSVDEIATSWKVTR